MDTVLSMINRLGGRLLFLVLGTFSVLGTSAAAQAERYVLTIWVDPDGCEHWVMDDGAEGYMSPHLKPEGLPVCRQRLTCSTLNTDQFFATDQHRIDARGRARLLNFLEVQKPRCFQSRGIRMHVHLMPIICDCRSDGQMPLRQSYARRLSKSANLLAIAKANPAQRTTQQKAYHKTDVSKLSAYVS